MFQSSAPGAYEVVYNLYPIAEDLFLPEAFVVSQDTDGQLAHVQQKALPETIGHFGLEYDESRQGLFALIARLQVADLEEHFHQGRGKPKPLSTLLQNKEERRKIERYINRPLAELFDRVSRESLPLTLDVDRKVLVKDFRVKTHKHTLEPYLSFRKRSDAVHYRLRLGNDRKRFRISQYDVVPVCNEPAWLIVDLNLFRVPHINGNMVKPFRKKDEVVIPKASVPLYFKKFILKVATNLDIEAEGFEVVSSKKLEKCLLLPELHLFDKKWVLRLKLEYQGATFYYGGSAKQRTSLRSEGDEIRITKVRRFPKAEQEKVDILKSMGLELDEEGNFRLPGEDDDMLGWLASNRSKLRDKGFKLEDAVADDKQLYLRPYRLELGANRENDWFDLHGTVTVGEFTFPFQKLVPFIRDENPYFPLPNGKFFHIPREWMARYKSLVQFARNKGEGLQLGKSQFALLQELGLREGEELAKALDEDDYEPSPLLKATLRPYQLSGVRWLVRLHSSGLGGCLADDMGLGKTLQTIALLLYAKQEREAELETTETGGPQLSIFDTVHDAQILQPLNALIVLPASLVHNWAAEISRFAPSLSIYRHVGTSRHRDYRLLARYDVTLTTYHTALRDEELLQKLEFSYIVLDESQQIKNRESKIFRAIHALNSEHRLSLSGTPMENSLSDLWSQMQFINPDLLGSFPFFRRAFIQPIERANDEEAKDRLRKLVAPYLLRRTKEEVAKDLPPLSSKVFFSEMTREQHKLYERERSSARNELLGLDTTKDPRLRIRVLRSLTRLRQIVNHPVLVRPAYERESGKFNDILEHWDVIRRSGHKVLFFSSFVKYLELFRAHFEEKGQPYAWLTGAQSGKEREKAIQRFEKNDEVQAFLISIKSGGTGLNLTAADYVFILDPWWNPTTEQQAIARAHRIGQDKHVISIRFITSDSIEEKIRHLQSRKAKLAKDIIDGARDMRLSNDDLKGLFE